MVVSPLGMALSLWALSLLLLLRGPAGQRWGSMVGGLGFAWLLLWSLPVASDALRGTLENQSGPREVAALPAQPVAVVLGGGVSGPRPPQRPDPDLGASADRVWHAARLYHAGKAQQLLLSGGSVRTGDGSEAEAMRRVLHDLGVPDAAIRLEDASTNTAGNAGRTAELLKAQGIERVLLVTSALHMPRAQAAFERAGLTVDPAPSDFEVIPMPLDLRQFLPDAGALNGSARAMKEIVGRWVGR